MKHRSTTPSLIIGLGIGAVFFFAIMVSKTSSSTPILKLKPELEKQFGARGFRCWLKANERRVEVRPPEGLPNDRATRRRIGGAAFLKYLELTKGDTVVESVLVLAPKGMTLASEEVDRASAEAAHDTEAQATTFVQTAAVAAGTSAALASVGPAVHGAAVFVVPAPGFAIGEGEARRLGQAVLGKDARITFVRVERGDGVAYEAGVDVAMLGSQAVAAIPTPTPPVVPK